MKILLLSPHTDDIELGAGGTIIKFMKKGYKIKWVVFSTCEDAVPAGLPKNRLKKEFLNVVKKVGIKDYEILDFKSRVFYERRQELLDKLYHLNKKFKPDVVVGPSIHDIHQDHSQVAIEMIRAFKKDSNILSYEEPWNNINFEPRFFSVLTKEEVEKKWNLLKTYKTQFILKRNYFTKEFVIGLARTRGTQVNSEFAEAFEVIRWRF